MLNNWNGLSLLCGILVILFQLSAQNPKSKINKILKLKPKTNNILAFFLGVLALIFSYSAQVKESNESYTERVNLNSKIETYSFKNDSLEKINQFYLDSIKKVSKNILGNTLLLKTNTIKLNEITNIIYNKTKDISKVSDDVYKNTQQITGNGSYPLASCSGDRFGKERQIVIFLKGEYAIPNLVANVTVIDDYRNVSGLDFRITGAFASTIKIGTIIKHRGESFNVTTKNETAILIRFNSDNHSWTETILISNQKQMWFIHDEKGKIIEKYKDEDFPTDANGEIVIWNNVKKKFEDI